jgi:hypothetical protein
MGDDDEEGRGGGRIISMGGYLWSHLGASPLNSLNLITYSVCFVT